MTDDNRSGPDGDVIWGVLGLLAGGVLAFKVLSAMGVREGDRLTLEEIAIGLALFLGPFWALMTAAEHLSKDVAAGRTTAATYWTTMAGLSVTALTLVGITSVDDLLALAR
ncbi:hypothetical protein [Streptomyces sp. NPDC058955]|uniref:hypothetical protein n=1 Tax=unclassified Streptomyces TaxID=2593676 RepID=UPI0036615E9F